MCGDRLSYRAWVEDERINDENEFWSMTIKVLPSSRRGNHDPGKKADTPLHSFEATLTV